MPPVPKEVPEHSASAIRKSENYMYDMMPTKDYFRTEETKKREEIDFSKLTKDEAYRLFKNLLREVGVSDSWRWDRRSSSPLCSVSCTPG